MNMIEMLDFPESHAWLQEAARRSRCAILKTIATYLPHLVCLCLNKQSHVLSKSYLCSLPSYTSDHPVIHMINGCTENNPSSTGHLSKEAAKHNLNSHWIEPKWGPQFHVDKKSRGTTAWSTHLHLLAAWFQQMLDLDGFTASPND